MSRGRKIYVWVYCIALGIGLILVGLRGESTRTIVTESACKQDPQGQACQQIFEATIRAFDGEVLDLLNRKLDHRSQHRQSAQPGGPLPPHPGGTNETTQGTAPGNGSTGGTAPVDDSGGGSGSDGNGPAQPPTQPPPTQPPPTEPPPPNPPPTQPSPGNPPVSPPSVGQGLGDTIDHVTGLGCQVTNVLGICIR